jgi:hypothetical protein
MSNNNLVKFLAPLVTFSGNESDARAEAWLKSIKRVKTVSGMEDEAALMIAASNMTSKAQVWWDTIEESTLTWVDFEAKFNKKFLSNRVAEAWSQIKAIKQGDDQEVGDFVEKLNNLFKVVNLSDDESKVSFFIASVKSSIAYDLERSRGSGGIRNYETVTEEAIEIEKLQKKYKISTTNSNKRVRFEAEQGNGEVTGGGSAIRSAIGSNDDRLSVDSLASLIEAVNQLNINMVQQQQQMSNLQQQQRQQQNNQQQKYQYQSNNGSYNSFSRPPYGGRSMQCWNCGLEGHPSRFCPNSGRNSNNAVMGSGNNGNNGSSNVETNGEMGKENGRQ